MDHDFLVDLKLNNGLIIPRVNMYVGLNPISGSGCSHHALRVSRTLLLSITMSSTSINSCAIKVDGEETTFAIGFLLFLGAFLLSLY